MTVTTFSDIHGSAELLGIERQYAAHLTTSFAMSVLKLSRTQPKLTRIRYAPLIASTSLLHGIDNDFQWVGAFRSWWDLSQENLLIPQAGGQMAVAPWELDLNTVLVAGSSSLEILARIHAIVDSHGYVEGPDRAWMADLLAEAVTTKIARAGKGWDGVIELLRAREDEPVVFSSSTTGGWPDAMDAVWAPKGREDVDPAEWTTEEFLEFYAQPVEVQWRQGMEKLRAAGGHDVGPDIFGSRGWGMGWSIFDLEELLDAGAI